MADGLDLKLEVEGVAKVKTMLAGLGLDVQDLKGAMSDVGDHAKSYFGGQVFASRGGAINQQWPRLSDKYAATKAKRFPGRPPLVRTGAMQRSFVSSPSTMSVTISNNDPHFKYHRSTASRSKIPRRAMIGIYNGMQAEVIAIIANALAEKIATRAS